MCIGACLPELTQRPMGVDRGVENDESNFPTFLPAFPALNIYKKPIDFTNPVTISKYFFCWSGMGVFA
jgi:hypothetical protein